MLSGVWVPPEDSVAAVMPEMAATCCCLSPRSDSAVTAAMVVISVSPSHKLKVDGESRLLYEPLDLQVAAWKVEGGVFIRGAR